MQEYQITISRTARYYLVKNEDTPVSELWIVLHGYGQLARFFLQHFEPLLRPGVCIVAPEALSRFYIQHDKKRIGASWMTSEFRDQEISDYINYISQVYQDVCNTQKIYNHKLIVFGFSQGVATLFRWLTNSGIQADTVVAWAGTIPPEIISAPNLLRHAQKKLFTVFGNHDAIVTTEHKNQTIDCLHALQIPFRTFTFSGGHSLDENTLLTLANEIRNQ
ncbi:MAG: dienelactone hydrolase family protein [Candidatus Competibacteraceae bacterium]|nr:dienelactone hydrolase family protein [Candidatus Competibacteraceae bacterium]